VLFWENPEGHGVSARGSLLLLGLSTVAVGVTVWTRSTRGIRVSLGAYFVAYGAAVCLAQHDELTLARALLAAALLLLGLGLWAANDWARLGCLLAAAYFLAENFMRVASARILPGLVPLGVFSSTLMFVPGALPHLALA